MTALLQHTTGVDEHIDLVINGFGPILHFDLPFALCFRPYCRLDRMLILDEAIAVVLIRDAVHVVMYLLGGGVVVGPMWIRSKAESVVVCGNVALTSWVSSSDIVSMFSGRSIPWIRTCSRAMCRPSLHCARI